MQVCYLKVKNKYFTSTTSLTSGLALVPLCALAGSGAHLQRTLPGSDPALENIIIVFSFTSRITY